MCSPAASRTSTRADQHGQQAAVLAHGVVFEIAHASCQLELCVALGKQRLALWRHEPRHRLADEFFARVTQHGQFCGVDGDHRAVGRQRVIAAGGVVVQVGDRGRALLQQGIGRGQVGGAPRDQVFEFSCWRSSARRASCCGVVSTSMATKCGRPAISTLHDENDTSMNAPEQRRRRRPRPARPPDRATGRSHRCGTSGRPTGRSPRSCGPAPRRARSRSGPRRRC